MTLLHIGLDTHSANRYFDRLLENYETGILYCNLQIISNILVTAVSYCLGCYGGDNFKVTEEECLE